MDKYEQIGKLADAYALIQEVVNKCDPEFQVALQSIADNVADMADQIEADA
jgi:hypothetical protein